MGFGCGSALLDLILGHPALAYELLVLGDEQRRYVEYIVLHHHRNGLVIQVVSVLNAIHATSDSRLDARRTASVHTNFLALLMRNFGGCLDLVEGELGFPHALTSRSDASSDTELDPVHTMLELLTHSLPHLVGTVYFQSTYVPVTVSSRGDHEVTTDEEPGSDEETSIEGPLPGYIDEISVSYRTNTGHASSESIHNVATGPDRIVRHRLNQLQFLSVWGDRSQVSVDSPEARKDIAPFQIEDAAFLLPRSRPIDPWHQLSYPVVIDDNSHVLHRWLACAVDNRAIGQNGFHLCLPLNDR